MSFRREVWKNKKKGGSFKKRDGFRWFAPGCGYDCQYCHGLEFSMRWVGKPKKKNSREYLKQLEEGF